jgi:ABC-type branched-subunit amino acid transport system substrate-binding protein
MFPTLALDFLNGLKLAFENSGKENFVPEFIVESVGNATGKSLLDAAEKMILQEEVDLTISFCSVFNLKELVSIFDAYKKPLIHIDLGGNVLKEEHTGPFVIHHTLNLWQSAYYAGVYAANAFGKKGALATSFYDGGYHLIESFVCGFTENGGNVVFNYVSPMDYKSESFLSMVEGIQNSNPDFIFTLFSYNEGNKIFKVISESPLNGKIPLLAAPLMTEEINNYKNYNIENVFSIASWAFDEQFDPMNDFISNYSKLYEDYPNIISLIGYEVGLTIARCIDKNGAITKKIGDCVYAIKLDTPRGELTFSGFNESKVSVNNIRKMLFADDQTKNTVVQTIDNINQEELYDKFKDLPYSGWQNPYIIT